MFCFRFIWRPHSYAKRPWNKDMGNGLQGVTGGDVNITLQAPDVIPSTTQTCMTRA